MAYLKPSNFNTILFILGTGCGLCFNCLFRFLKSLRKPTWFYLGLGYSKDGATHSESLGSSRTPSRTNRSTSFLKISLCNFSIGYGFEHIGFTFYFNSKYDGCVFQVPSVPSNNSSDFCSNFSDSLRCDSVRYPHWFSITLFKSAFWYL